MSTHIDLRHEFNLRLMYEPVPCSGDDRFIQDKFTTEDTRALKAICATCPLFTLCREITARERPTAGFYAGLDRTKK